MLPKEAATMADSVDANANEHTTLLDIPMEDPTGVTANSNITINNSRIRSGMSEICIRYEIPVTQGQSLESHLAIHVDFLLVLSEAFEESQLQIFDKMILSGLIPTTMITISNMERTLLDARSSSTTVSMLSHRCRTSKLTRTSQPSYNAPTPVFTTQATLPPPTTLLPAHSGQINSPTLTT